MRHALLFGAWLLAVPVHADAVPEHTTPLHALFPSASALREKQTHELRLALEGALGSLAAVHSVHVELLLPPPLAPLDAPQSPARAWVKLELTGSGPTDADVLRVLRSLSPPQTEVTLSVQRTALSTPAKREPANVKVGPFTVAAISAPGLRLMLTMCLCVNALMATLLLARRYRRPRE